MFGPNSEEYKDEWSKGLEQYKTETVYGDVKKVTVVKPAVVEEVVKKNIVEVIQPVVHRETIQPVIVHVTKPIYEEVQEGPTIVHEIRDQLTLPANMTVEELVKSHIEKLEQSINNEEITETTAAADTTTATATTTATTIAATTTTTETAATALPQTPEEVEEILEKSKVTEERSYADVAATPSPAQSV